ncbi:MAG TPA: FAD-dependent oxidoreductase [Myxococcota bacterium]|jgi:NADPH-dependent glutamate synthase beta subunit-like oxidoreductase
MPRAMSSPAASHSVAVIGGAVAGAEVADTLASRGARVAVIEQNPRPYGKIEDGLPRWHVALRRKEYATIGEKLSQPNVDFVPLTSIGRDVGFRELTRDWGFSAVVLACGAWRDRPLPVEGAERWVGRGLIYQNPFIVWFNHANEKGYRGEVFEPRDGAIVVGGGLASIDVVKVLMLETARAKLRERGIQVPMVELEVKGIPKILAGHGLVFEDLGLAGCTLYYRRRAEDMPLVEVPDGATPERAAKVLASRAKLLEKAMEKYRFQVRPLCMPDGLIVEQGRLAGLRFRVTRADAGKIIPSDETFEARGSCVISSIGSIPEPIAGIETKGELFRFTDWELGRLDGHPNVFSAGNVVTGKGNIVASRKHAASVAGRVAEEIAKLPPATADAQASVRARVQERQRAVGYTGDYASWMAKVTPPDLE